jgi:hypothetical protein
MAHKKKISRISLRLDEDFHSYLAAVADDLGVGQNALMNLLLRRAVGPFPVNDREFLSNRGGKPRTLVTLRIEADLDEVIRDQDVELNLLITDMLYFALPPFVVEARLYKEYLLTGRYKFLFKEWKTKHPNKTIEEFDNELRRLLAGQPSALAKLETPRPAPPIPTPAPNRWGWIVEPVDDKDVF